MEGSSTQFIHTRTHTHAHVSRIIYMAMRAHKHPYTHIHTHTHTHTLEAFWKKKEAWCHIYRERKRERAIHLEEITFKKGIMSKGQRRRTKMTQNERKRARRKEKWCFGKEGW